LDDRVEIMHATARGRISSTILQAYLGGRPCPPEWGSLSESVCDLSNAILCNPAWNPLELYSPAALKIPTRRPLADDIPFGEARELVVDVPVEAEGYSG
jgi:hypothetical protein